MSEIDPQFVHNLNRGSHPGAKGKPASSDAKSKAFELLLDRQMKTPLPQPELSAGSALPEIQSAFSTEDLELPFDKAYFSRKLEASLKQLETYAAWLEDPEKPLTKADALLDLLTDQTRLLKTQLDPHTKSYPDLAQILNRLETTVQIEKVKLNRGDYL